MRWNELNDILIAKAKDKGIPLMGQFELTARCNFRCKMCYVCSPQGDETILNKEIKAQQWIDIAKSARDRGLLYLLLTGGEVFLYPEFRELYETLSLMGFNITIYSNGALITPEIAEWLSRYPPSMIRITMYGASQKTYGRVCGSEEGYERVMEAIELLRKHGIKFQINTTVIKDNIKDVDKLIELSQRLGVQIGVCTYVTPRYEGDSEMCNNYRLSPGEASRLEASINKKFKENQIDLIDNTEYEKMLLSEANTSTGCELSLFKETKEAFRCGVGKCSFWITCDGRMIPCGGISIAPIYPFKEGFPGAWEKLQKSCAGTKESQECKECTIKEYCSACPANLRSETGYFDKAAPYLCELAAERQKCAAGKAEDNRAIKSEE